MELLKDPEDVFVGPSCFYVKGYEVEKINIALCGGEVFDKLRLGFNSEVFLLEAVRGVAMLIDLKGITQLWCVIAAFPRSE